MLIDLFPRLHTRLSTLPLVGPYVEEFVVWLQAQGYPRLPIRLRIRELPRVDALLRRQDIHTVDELSYVLADVPVRRILNQRRGRIETS